MSPIGSPPFRSHDGASGEGRDLVYACDPRPLPNPEEECVVAPKRFRIAVDREWATRRSTGVYLMEPAADVLRRDERAAGCLHLGLRDEREFTQRFDRRDASARNTTSVEWYVVSRAGRYRREASRLCCAPLRLRRVFQATKSRYPRSVTRPQTQTAQPKSVRRQHDVLHENGCGIVESPDGTHGLVPRIRCAAALHLFDTVVPISAPSTVGW